MAKIHRETFNFSPDFQDLILACILKRPEFAKYASVVSSKYFTGAVESITARVAFAYHKEKGHFPTKEMLIELMTVEARKQNEDAKEYRDYVYKVFKTPTLTVWRDVHERVIKFCRERAVLKALIVGADAFKAGEEPEGGWVGMFESAVKVGAELDELESLKFDPARLIERPEPVLKLGNHVLATPGNLVAISGLPKVGKSAAVSAILAALIVADGDDLGDRLGFSGLNPKRKAVLHFDSEQAAFDHQNLVQLTMERAGFKADEPCTELHSYCVASFSPAARLSALKNRARELHEAGGLSSVIVDGVADLMGDPNDAKESFALVDELFRLAARTNAVVVVVLHENPIGKGVESFGKTRGHLGSQLERKSETNLRLKKNADGVTVMFTEKSRHCHVPEASGHCFRWDDAQKRHALSESVRKMKNEAAKKELRETLLPHFTADNNGPAVKRHAELAKAISDADETCVRTARRWIKQALSLGIISKEGDRYSLV